MAESFTLNILGSASARPNIYRNPSAQVLQVRGHLFLIDCGEGTQKAFLKQKRILREWIDKHPDTNGVMNISFQALDAICLSHIHGDHIFGIFGLLSTMGLEGRRDPVHIYAPSNFAPILKFFLSYYGEGLKYELVFHPLKMKAPEVVYENSSMELVSFPLKHGIDAYGFLFREKTPGLNVNKESVSRYGLTLKEIALLKSGNDVVREPGPDEEPSIENGFTRFSGSDEPMIISCADNTYLPFKPRSYAYCSDTTPFPALASWVEGIDVLYHEATYSAMNSAKAHERGHSTNIDAAKCASDAHVGKLLVGHYSASLTDEFLATTYHDELVEAFPNSVMVHDGDIFEI